MDRLTFLGVKTTDNDSRNIQSGFLINLHMLQKQKNKSLNALKWHQKNQKDQIMNFVQLIRELNFAHRIISMCTRGGRKALPIRTKKEERGMF